MKSVCVWGGGGGVSSVACEFPLPPSWSERVKEGPVRPGEWEAVALRSRLASSLGIPHPVIWPYL